MTNTMHRILITEEVAQETIEYLEKHGINVKRGSGLDEETIIRDIHDCDAVMVRVMRITRTVIENAPNLRIIAKHGVGCDSIDLSAADQRGIMVINTPGANTESVAEHTMALILACARNLRQANMEYSKGNYGIRDSLEICEISKKTLALVGFGQIAQEVAKKAYYGFNMRVIAYTHRKKDNSVPDYVEIYEDLCLLASEADFMSIHISGIEENRGFINFSLINRMKATAYIINTSRGFVVDTEALVSAVEAGRIAGAGLDVCDPEPVGNGSILFTNPRIILTPHCGAASRESMIRMGLQASEKVVGLFKKEDRRNESN